MVSEARPEEPRRVATICYLTPRAVLKPCPSVGVTSYACATARDHPVGGGAWVPKVGPHFHQHLHTRSHGEAEAPCRSPHKPIRRRPERCPGVTRFNWPCAGLHHPCVHRNLKDVASSASNSLSSLATCLSPSRPSRLPLTVVGVGVTHVPQLWAFNVVTPMSSAMALCGPRCGGIAPYPGEGPRRRLQRAPHGVWPPLLRPAPITTFQQPTSCSSPPPRTTTYPEPSRRPISHYLSLSYSAVSTPPSRLTTRHSRPT